MIYVLFNDVNNFKKFHLVDYYLKLFDKFLNILTLSIFNLINHNIFYIFHKSNNAYLKYPFWVQYHVLKIENLLTK
jgi:hypothetical protein